MSTQTINQRLRQFLLIMALSIFLATPVELILADHTANPTQLIPFALSGLGLVGVLFILWRQGRNELLSLRAIMIVVFAGSLFGIFEHILHNFEFELEIRPNAGASDVWWEALKGVNPLLAPGILALAALLVMAATYKHPALLNELSHD